MAGIRRPGDKARDCKTLDGAEVGRTQEENRPTLTAIYTARVRKAEREGIYDQRASLEERVYQCKLAGMPAAKIGEELGVPVDRVWEMLRSSFVGHRASALEWISYERAVDIARVDALIEARWRDAMTGYGEAVRDVIKLIDRRSVLLSYKRLDPKDDDQRTKNQAINVYLPEQRSTPITPSATNEEPSAAHDMLRATRELVNTLDPTIKQHARRMSPAPTNKAKRARKKK